MTDTGNEPLLQDLEPLDPGDQTGADGGAAPTTSAMTLQTLRAGLPPPAFNPQCRDKTSYRFLMCGVLIVLGCMMPFSADVDLVGYKTMSGAFFMFIGLGMVWTWWGAIHHNRSTGASLKWLLLCVIPLIVQVMNLIGYNAVQALQDARNAGHLTGDMSLGTAETYGWGDVFSDMLLAVSKKIESPQAATRVELFFRCFGTGRIFVLLGALLAEVFFIAGIVGGAKQNKAQKQARMSQAAERRRR